MSRLGFGSNNTPDPGFVGENKRGNRQTRAYSWDKGVSYCGKVKRFKSATQQHEVLFDDGDVKWYHLDVEQASGLLEWDEKSRPSGAASSKTTPLKPRSKPAADASAPTKGRSAARPPTPWR